MPNHTTPAKRMSRFEVVNFERYQHHAHTAPPWIKLYRSVLTNYEFTNLPDATKAHLMLIWLLASQMGNALPYDADWLAVKIDAKEPIDLVLLRKSGFIRLKKGRKSLATHAEMNTPRREEREKRRERDRVETEKVTPGRSRSPPNPSKSGEIWLSYSEAYERRYGAKPVRNATVNACLCKFVDRVGAEEAPDIAAWYLRSENHLYYASGHSVQMLLRDAEKIRTEWATGRTITNTRARQRDQAQTQFNNAEEAVRILKKEGSWKD